MVKRLRKTLPKHFDELVTRGDLIALQRVFETCDLNARGGVWKAPALSWFGVSEEFMRWLIGQGADVHAPDSHGATPLHHHAGSVEGHPEVLLEFGADPNATDEYGRTALFETGHHLAYARALIAAGSDVHATDEYGDTALLHVLERTGPADIAAIADWAELLIEAGAPITEPVRSAVSGIGERFEEVRDIFDEVSLPETERSLERLYALFGVAPAPKLVKHNGAEAIHIDKVTASRDWPAQYNALWDYLVPAAGPATTAQGEAVRIAGLIAQEIDANGGVNWGSRHRAMLTHFTSLVARGTPLAGDELDDARALVKSLHRGRGSDEALDRIRELATIWVLANPEPIRV